MQMNRLKAIAVAVTVFCVVLIFHSSKIYRNMHEWEWAENPPRAAKLAGWISLISWGIVIIAGRTTAYNF